MGACVSSPLIVECRSRSHWNSLFQAYRFSYKLLVIEFTAAWSGPCKRMEPVVRDCAAKYYDVQFIKIDIDRLSDVAGELGVDVTPTFVLLKRGKVLDRVVGADKDELERKIEKHRV